MARPLSLTKDATPENLALFLSLVDVLVDRHGLTQGDLVDLRLLAEEACANVVMHAYAGGPPGELTLQVGLDGDTAEIVIEDEGRAFDPDSAPPPSIDAAVDDRSEGGLGWHLIRSLSDELHYERVGERNRLTLRKRVARA
jgi:serine/threonine-protein kinase RsbW